MHYLPEEPGPAGKASAYRQMARLLQYRAVRVRPEAGRGDPRAASVWSGGGRGANGLRAGHPGSRQVTLEVSGPGRRPRRPLCPDHESPQRLFLSLTLLPQVSLLEELLSPLLTPLFLLFWFCPRSLEIIDFFHHFTVDVAGVGDICSFALMDVKRHGHPQVRAHPWLCGVVVG